MVSLKSIFNRLKRNCSCEEYLYIGNFISSDNVKYDVVVFKENKNNLEPHFHVSNSDNRKEEYIIKIKYPEYYDHGYGSTQMMDKKLENDLAMWLGCYDDRRLGGSFWDSIVTSWIGLNRISPSDLDEVRNNGLPNYYGGINLPSDDD